VSLFSAFPRHQYKNNTNMAANNMFRPSTSQFIEADATGDSADPSDPMQFLSEMRRRALTRKGLRSQREEQMTLEHLIRTTRAILSTNQEIWGRCKRFCCGKVAEDTANDSSAKTTSTNQANKTNSEYLFFRLAHSTVKASSFYDGSLIKDGILLTESALEVTKCSFHLPLAIPYPLNRMIALPRQPKDDIMPNFGLLLKRSMLLSEEILVLFLMEFKDFLEKLQVALGEVDSWLLEAENGKAFLREHFGKDSDFFEFDEEFYESKLDFQERSCLDRLKKIKCSRCDSLCSRHDANKSGWVDCPSQKDEPGFFPLSLGRTLMLFRMKGRIEMSFRIDEEEGRNRLIKFLSFASGSRTRSHDDDDERQE
jgi:hypothetical protein